MYIRYLQCIMCKAGDSYAAVMARVLYLKHSSCMLTIKTFLLWFKSDTFVWSVSVELRRLLLMLYFALTYQWRLKLGLCVWIRHGPGLRLVVPPPPMLQQRHYNYYVYALRVPASVPRHRYFFRFARILNGFRWNLPEVVTSHYTANRLNIYILGEIGAGTKEQDTTEYSNRRQSVLPRYQTGGDA